MRKYYLLGILITIFSSCHSTPRFVEDVLNLDDFDFDLNLDIFFDDEKYFKEGSDMKLQSEKGSFKDTTFIYYKYSTFSFNPEVPLAKYKNVQFEKLHLISDSTDQHPLVVVGSTYEASPDDVKIIIDDLLKIDNEPQIKKAFMDGISIVFRGNDKIITVYLNISVDDYDTIYISIDENYKATKEAADILTDKRYEEIISKLKNKEEFEFSVFVINPTFDKIFNKYHTNSSIGFMTKYRTE